MTQTITASRTSSGVSTRTLLASGVVAGPVFAVVAVVELLTRPGFDLGRHPLSLLSVGEWGWVQVANFILTGLLSILGAVGVRRVLRGTRAGTWGPVLIATYGVGLVGAGLFSADPAMGFPTGTPDTVPDTLSWHATLHGVFAPIAFLSLTVACFVFTRRFITTNQRALAAYSLTTGVATLILTMWPTITGVSIRLAIAAIFMFGWLSILIGRIARGQI